MKRCPTCNQVYADESLNFCLADGSALSAADTRGATASMPAHLTALPPAGSPSYTTRASRRGFSPIFAYAGIGLLVLLVGGAVVMWVTSDAKPAQVESPQAAPQATASPTPAPTQAPVPKLYRVVGVAEDDVLYVRDRPGPRNASVGQIPPDGVSIQILEDTVRVGQSTWVRVKYKGITGWVNNRFLREQ
jgi:hypothetical protein